MKKNNPTVENTPFDHICKKDEQGYEYWWAKDLGKLLGYTKYADFLPVINKAKIACSNSGCRIEDHFQEAAEVRPVNNGARRRFNSVKLSRYACYLTILNADPAKEPVAMGQAYLVMQSRGQELLKAEKYQGLKTEEQKRLLLRRELSRHNLILASLARKAGIVAPADFAIFHNHGYMGLYGGLDTTDIRARKGLSKNQNILDYMGSTELSANLLRVKHTEEQLKKQKADSVAKAGQLHFEAGQHVRHAMVQLGGITPEELPAAQDIHQIGTGKRKGKRKP